MWYFHDGTNQIGPFDTDDARARMQHGELVAGQHQVFLSASNTWQPIEEHEAFSDLFGGGYVAEEPPSYAPPAHVTGPVAASTGGPVDVRASAGGSGLSLLTPLRPVFNYLDSGRIYGRGFELLYKLCGAVSLILPLYVMIEAIRNDLFDAGGKVIVAFIFVWFAIAVSAFVGFQVWWIRSEQRPGAPHEDDAFGATEPVAHLLRTGAEWAGQFVMIVGFVGSLVLWVFLRDMTGGLGGALPLVSLSPSPVTACVNVITGALIILVAHFTAEQARALVQIVRNTQR